MPNLTDPSPAPAQMVDTPEWLLNQYKLGYMTLAETEAALLATILALPSLQVEKNTITSSEYHLGQHDAVIIIRAAIENLFQKGSE